ncbi:MAG: APC family permease [Gemmatimonadetes bacterium]|nr:APC family permease [Gemmatimonadota bacterium]
MSTVKSEHGLIRAVGTFGLAAGVVNVTVGGGIFRLPSEVARDLGPAAPVAFIVCAVVMAMIGLSIVQAGSRVSTTGGPYTYVEIAFGPFAGFMAGVMTWVIGVTAIAAIGDVFIANLAGFIPALATPVGRTTGLFAVFAFLTIVNVLGVQYGARLNAVTTVLKLLPLLVLVLLGVFAIDSANLAVTTMPAASTVTRTSMVLLFAFTGVEFALVPGGEIKDPSRTVPRGILLGLGGVTVLYLAIQLVAQGILGPALAGSATPLADAAGAAVGPWGRSLLLIGVIVSTFGYLSGMSLASPRTLYALARDGYLPRAMAAVHPRFHTPWVSVIVQIAICFGLAVWSDFGPLALISNVAALLVYFGCAAGAWELKRRGVQDEGTTPYAMPGGAIIPVLSCIAILGLLTSITASEWLVLLEVAAGATVIFFATRSHRASIRTTG